MRKLFLTLKALRNPSLNVKIWLMKNRKLMNSVMNGVFIRDILLHIITTFEINCSKLIQLKLAIIERIC
jgi:hypothetical protein